MNMRLPFPMLLFFLAGHILFLFFPVHAISEQTHYSSYENKNLGFSVDIPSKWESEDSGLALVFSGRRGTDQWRTTINFQVIETGDWSFPSFIADLKSQWQTHGSYKLISEQSGSLDGKNAIRLLVEYRLKDADELIRQEQFAVLHQNYLYLIGYTAPNDLFEKYYGPMSRALDSFRIFPPNTKKSSRVENAENELVSLHSFIQAVQEFREQNCADGKTGWLNYSDQDLLKSINSLNRNIWPEEDIDSGSSYFFSLSMTSIGRLNSRQPVVGFYHPWSDVWLITQWQKDPAPHIISVEMLLGEWLRNMGSEPFDLIPAWLRGKGFRTEQLAKSVAENIQKFDDIVHGEIAWQKTLDISERNPLTTELNYPAASNALLFSWIRAIDSSSADSGDPFLNSLVQAGMSVIEVGKRGEIGKAIALAPGTSRHTQQTLNNLDPDLFALMSPVYWTADDKAATLYMTPGSNSDFCLTLRYIRSSARPQLDRVDLLYFPEIMEMYKRQVSR